MHPSGAGLDHALHELKGIQYTAKASLGVSDDGQKPIDTVIAFGVMDLIRSLQDIIDIPYYARHAVDRIQTLIRVHLKRVIGIGRDLPTAEIDRVQACFGHLYRLITRERT